MQYIMVLKGGIPLIDLFLSLLVDRFIPHRLYHKHNNEKCSKDNLEESKSTLDTSRLHVGLCGAAVSVSGQCIDSRIKKNVAYIINFVLCTGCLP